MRRFFAFPVLLLLALGCDEESFDGFIEVRGAWADGEPVAFRHGAHLRSEMNRVNLIAVDAKRPRFMGVRIAFDPLLITASGTYEVDRAEFGRLEVYVFRPLGERDTKEYEVNQATLELRKMPSAMAIGQLEGSLRSARLERMDNGEYLTLTGGEFSASVTR